MTFLEERSRWPEDLSRKNIFLVSAVSEIGRKITLKNMQIPISLYKYEQDLSSFDDAQDADKYLAADIITKNCVERDVQASTVTELYEEEIFVSLQFDGNREDWDLAQQIAVASRSIDPESIINNVTIALGVFAGVAQGRVKAYARVDGWDFQLLEPNKLNHSDPEIVKARLALGRIDPSNPTSLNPRGPAELFLDAPSYRDWYARGGLQEVKIQLAKNVCMEIACRYPKTLPSGYSFEKIKENYLKPFELTPKSQMKLWNMLPDVPFKLPGRR